MDHWTYQSDQDAKELLLDVIDSYPSFAPAHSLYAATLQTIDLLLPGYVGQEKDRQLARDHLNIALSIDDTDARTHANMAWNYMLSREFIKAERHFDISADINEYDTELMISRATGKAYLGKAEEGMALAKQAISYTPAHPDYYYGNFAAICVLANEFEQAINLVRVSPEVWPEIWAWHAIASIQLGNSSEAKKAITIFLTHIRKLWHTQNQPSEDDVIRWLFRITALKQPSDILKFSSGLCSAGLKVPDEVIQYYLHLLK